MTKMRIKRFDPQTLKPHRIIIIVGKRGTGKSVMQRDLMYHLSGKVDFGLAMTPTEESADMFRQHMPDSWIYNSFSTAKLDQMLLSHLKINSQNPKTNLGLDAGVICFSKERNILWYSGAKINLYQNKDSQIIEYKGDKKSIGYRFEKDPKKFKSYEINLSEENSFLIFSDGVTDQIGGSQRMMFGKKRVFDSFLNCNDSHKPAALTFIVICKLFRGEILEEMMF